MNLYDLLGVPRKATAAQIRRAFQKRARCFHPDLNPGDPVAAARFREISEAFEVLSDAQRRGDYDRGAPGVRAVAPAVPAVPEIQFQGFDFTLETRGRASFRELWGEVLEQRKQADAEARPGEDLEEKARLTFAEAYHGTERRFQIVRQGACPDCHGTGDLPRQPVTCAACRGTGQVRASRGHMVFLRRCDECGAAGAISRRPCDRCAGAGRGMHGEWLQVNIPPGVQDGERLRLSGAGNAGVRGGPPGDFVLAVEVEPHPVYRREKDDLHCTVPITIAEAALGGHVDVPTPDGPVTIELPAGTQEGQTFRLRKRGFPRMGGGRGDLHVQVRVQVPRVTEGAARDLMRQFAALQRDEPRRALFDLPESVLRVR